MNNFWKYISLALIGFIGGIFAWEQTAKPKEVTNIENNTKIKNNKAPITSDVVTDVKQPTKIKKCLRLFKRHKNKTT